MLAIIPVHRADRAQASAPSAIDRPDEPVVLEGDDLPDLLGVAPDRVVAFIHEDGWAQVPVQVDERVVVDFGRDPSKGGGPTPSIDGTVYGTQAVGKTALQYADPGTFVGADTDPMVDGDDEIVFMADDVGSQQAASGDDPAGVIAGSGVQLTFTDPLDPIAEGTLYLFESDGTLDGSAGQSYVDYDFDLASGDYRTTYQRANGPNPESSTVTTDHYRHGFSDRWILDEGRIDAGGATGVDILDRYRFQFQPGSCGRSTATFTAAEGAFVVNRSGPVRALRSFVGANSGPYTQRTHRFYAARHDIVTDLRVHPVNGLMEFFDYSDAARDMRYTSSTQATPVTVDGLHDTVSTTIPDWELLSGPQGSLTTLVRSVTDLPGIDANSSWYYEDRATAPFVTQCTGDGQALANSGRMVTGEVPCTDPEPGCGHLQTTRSLHYAPPGRTNEQAATWATRADTPLVVDVDARPIPGPNLVVSVEGTTAFAGDRLEATITVDNVGDEALSGVEVTRPAACAAVVGNLAVGDEASIPCSRPTSADELPFPDKTSTQSILVRATSNETGPQDLDISTVVLPSRHGLGDVPSWVEGETDWIVFHRIATGYPDNTYRPDNPVTRAEITRMLHRFAGTPDTTGLPHHGLGDVPPWVDEATTWITHDPDGNGPLRPIATGYPDDTYQPDNPVTRAQVTRMLCRLEASGQIDRI